MTGIYVHVGTLQVSRNHNYLAYTLDITGAERFMLQVKNLNIRILENFRVHDDADNLVYVIDANNFRSGLNRTQKRILVHMEHHHHHGFVYVLGLSSCQLGKCYVDRCPVQNVSGNMTAAGSKLPFKLRSVQMSWHMACSFFSTKLRIKYYLRTFLSSPALLRKKELSYCVEMLGFSS
ncbi:hypothetical protein POM88_020146 [Heracleum sosnowskyi]|uniref:Uncharacterized protein n=1 Tax=Heracleum sosnowskyi TaxID=360622 RepID=A0AAD8MR68_9APIA|nr:hypothetical protein POM88_020146 [Heracleum sosnowskyi]